MRGRSPNITTKAEGHRAEGQAHHGQAHREINGRDEARSGRTSCRARARQERGQHGNGEVVANASKETPKATLEDPDSGVELIKTLYTNDLDQGPTSRRRCAWTRPPTRSTPRAIYRMMRPGEPPTEDAVKTLFNGFSSARTATTCPTSAA